VIQCVPCPCCAPTRSILNCFFYIFLTLGTALWALGIKENDTTTDVDERVDMALLASPALAGIAYLLGAAVTHTKVPIYIILSFEYAALTWRFWQVSMLKPRRLHHRVS
jgi:hypothetical protein